MGEASLPKDTADVERREGKCHGLRLGLGKQKVSMVAVKCSVSRMYFEMGPGESFRPKSLPCRPLQHLLLLAMQRVHAEWGDPVHSSRY